MNLNNKKFKLVSNSENGQVDASTIFEYVQTDNKFKGVYSDDQIVYSSIVGIINSPDDIYLTYHCILKDGTINVGDAKATATMVNEKIKLSLDWKWLAGGKGAGTSEYIEI